MRCERWDCCWSKDKQTWYCVDIYKFGEICEQIYMRHLSHPWSSDGEICKSWGELEAVCGTALDEDWGLLERVCSTWETISLNSSIGQGFPQRLNNLASALVLTAEVVLSPSHPCRRDHPRWEIFLTFLRVKRHWRYLCPMCWKVLKENWGPIHSLLAGPMCVTISTWGEEMWVCIIMWWWLSLWW